MSGPTRWALLAALAAAACTTSPPLGDLSMGDYSLNATSLDSQPPDSGTASSCQLPSASDAGTGNFSFALAITQQTDAGLIYLTFAGCEPSASNCARVASWDGQVLSSTESAPRSFPECTDCVVTVTETIDLALYSRSQADAVGRACPEDSLDGGLPKPTSDGGITPPRLTATGFDAVLACGTLRASLAAVGLDGGACDARCSQCPTHFLLAGNRK